MVDPALNVTFFLAIADSLSQIEGMRVAYRTIIIDNLLTWQIH